MIKSGKLGMWIGVGMLGIFVLLAWVGPAIAPYAPDHEQAVEFKKINGITEVSTAPSPPSKEHWFGTDRYGRDLLTLYLYGLKYTVFVPVVIVFLQLFLGVSLGCWAGLSGRRRPVSHQVTGGLGEYSGDYRFVFPFIPIGDEHPCARDLLDLASGRHTGGDGDRSGRFRHTAENGRIKREVVIYGLPSSGCLPSIALSETSLSFFKGGSHAPFPEKYDFHSQLDRSIECSGVFLEVRSKGFTHRDGVCFPLLFPKTIGLIAQERGASDRGARLVDPFSLGGLSPAVVVGLVFAFVSHGEEN